MTTILDLPREIRDAIYDAVLQKQKPFQMIVPNYLSRTSRANTVFSVSYMLPNTAETQEPGSYRPHDLKWLLANKQMRNEAIEQFQRKATWTITDTVADGEGSGMKGRWANPTRRGRAKQGGHCLLMPSTARNITVQMCLPVSVYLEVDSRGKPIWNIGADDRAEDITPRLASELSGSQNLQTLRISIRPWAFFFSTPAGLPFRVELGQLHWLDAPSLRRMEIKVEYKCERFEARKDFVSALEGALDRIGMGLIGGKGGRAHDVDFDTGYQTSVYTYTRS